MVRLEITGKHFDETPKWWQNFLNECKQSHPCESIVDVTEKILKEEYNATKEYGTKYTLSKAIQALVFETEEYKTWFILKWS